MVGMLENNSSCARKGGQETAVVEVIDEGTHTIALFRWSDYYTNSWLFSHPCTLLQVFSFHQCCVCSKCKSQALPLPYWAAVVVYTVQDDFLFCVNTGGVGCNEAHVSTSSKRSSKPWSLHPGHFQHGCC